MTAPGQQRPRPPKKRDRNADGWQLIGYYMERNGIVDQRDADIGLAVKWKTSTGLGDARRVREVRAHVNKLSKRDRDRGLQPGDPKATFSGWCFAYRNIEGAPSSLEDVNGGLYDSTRGLLALLGHGTRLKQHSTECARMAFECRKMAQDAAGKGRLDIAIACLDIERDYTMFGQPQDVHVEALRVLLEGWV
jgi:hypothetical protein